ncbi:MAG: hypothetical protein GEU75_04105 [Dehalococcoidia bacterium]|nr:hypothetical protein [Dehalococcoidia bacterium]
MVIDKDGHPPQRGGALIPGIIRDTLALCVGGLTGYWHWAGTARGWPARFLLFLPLLLVIYAAVSFSGLVKA